MRVLTIYQPWASLECLGLKGTETRGRGTKYRGPLLIHAGKRWDSELETHYWRIYAWLSKRRLGGPNLPPLPLPLGDVLGLTELREDILVTEDNQTQFSEADRELGDCSVGRHVWVLGPVQVLPTPIHWTGAQGLWTAPVELVARVLQQFRGHARTELIRDRKLEADRVDRRVAEALEDVERARAQKTNLVTPPEPEL